MRVRCRGSVDTGCKICEHCKPHEWLELECVDSSIFYDWDSFYDVESFEPDCECIEITFEDIMKKILKEK